MVIKLRACDVVVTLSIGKSWHYQKLPICYVTVTSCVSRGITSDSEYTAYIKDYLAFFTILKSFEFEYNFCVT